nr:Pyridoxine/pyridoxamine 5'-phosphate oxidase [Ipomoea batatas]
MSAVNIVGKSKKELYDIMCEMKKLMEQNEEQARQILIENPTLARDLFHAQIMLGMVQPMSTPTQSTQASPSHAQQSAPAQSGFSPASAPLSFKHSNLHNFLSSVTPTVSLQAPKQIAEFAEVHPGLMTFKTTDLSPASWISVAWYPIYQIPTKGNHKDRLSTCFLIYHALSASSIRGGVNPDKDENKKGKKVLEMVKGEEGNNNIKKSTGDVLYPYPFGMTTYRLDDEIWINANTFDDYERIIDLYNAAESWLKRLNFWHHDFNFFTSKLSLQGLSI